MAGGDFHERDEREERVIGERRRESNEPDTVVGQHAGVRSCDRCQAPVGSGSGAPPFEEAHQLRDGQLGWIVAVGDRVAGTAQMGSVRAPSRSIKRAFSA
jgi:hypothetical protein